MNHSNEMESKLDATLNGLKQKQISSTTLSAMRPHLETLKQTMDGEINQPSSMAAIIAGPGNEDRWMSSHWKWETGGSIAALILIWMSLELSKPAGQVFAQVIDRVLNASGYAISLNIQSHHPGSISSEEEQSRFEAIENMATQPFLRSRLALVKELESTPLGERDEKSLSLSGFRLRHQDIKYEVWAEQDSGEPYEMQLHGTFDGGPSWTIVLNQFVFDSDGNAVTTQVNSGFGNPFRHETSGNFSPGEKGSSGVSGFVMSSSDGSSHLSATQVLAHQSDLDPKDLVRSLETMLPYHNGRFPENLEPTRFIDGYLDAHGLQSPLSGEEQNQLDQALEKAAVALSAPNRLRNRDWQYNGKGVVFGERKPVCYWRSGSGGLFTVIYGDLGIETNIVKP